MRLTGRSVTAGMALLFGVPGAVALFMPVPGLDREAATVLCIGALLLAAIAATNPDPMGTAVASPGVGRRYVRELALTMTGYVLVLAASLWLLKRIDPPLLRAAVALAPLLPICLALCAMLRYLRALDELQQRIELQSLAIATGLVSMLYMAGGLLQSAGLLEVAAGDAMIWVFPWSAPSTASPAAWSPGATNEPAMKSRVRELREARGWSQAQLGERLEVSRQTVNAIETGKYDPSLPLAFRIAALFDASIESIFFPEESE